jgi:DNA polymerase III sliding clamp (beta) subunit (PCNA family)
MKMTVPLKTFATLVEKSASGALTKDSQDEERKKIRPTDSCVKISSNKDSIVFESSSPKISILCSIPKDENTITEQEGSFCVEASSYLKVLNTLSNKYSIQISYEENENYGKDSFAGVVQPNGKITTIAIDNKSEKRKGKNDTFPVSEFVQVDYNYNKVVLSLPAKTFKEAVDQVIFAIDPTDLSNILDKIAIVVSGKKVYLAGTDGKRCAIFFIGENEKDVQINSDEQKFLIDGNLLKTSCKSFEDDEKIEIIDCENNEHIIIASERLKIKLCIASEEIKQQFPNFINILSLALPTNIVANKADLLEAVEFLSLYNAEKSIFHINAGKSEIKVDAARRGTDPETAIVGCEQIESSLINPVAMSNGFIKDGCKKISGNNIKISFSKDEKKIKMSSIDKDNNFIYLMQSMTPN